MRLYAGNLPETTTKQDLHNMFAKYGILSDFSLTKYNKRAFSILHVDAGALAILELEGKEISGSSIKVAQAVDRYSSKKLEDITVKIRDLENDFKNIFEISNLLLGTVESGYFVELNPKWTLYLGWTLDELRRVPFLSFVHPEDKEITDKVHLEARSGSDIKDFVNRYVTREGEYKRIKWNSSSIVKNGKTYFQAEACDDI